MWIIIPICLMTKVLILHSDVPPDAAQDELDVLVQAESVSAVLRAHGYETAQAPFSMEIGAAVERISRESPDLIFNLVETIGGSIRFSHIAPTVFDYLRIPYTGCSTKALFITSDKVLTKALLAQAQIPTPGWISSREKSGGRGTFLPGQKYILKSVFEDGSVGIYDECVRSFGDRTRLEQALRQHEARLAGPWFAEEYIDGREFNLALSANGAAASGDPAVEVLPPSEIEFHDFPADKPRIVGYKAKWEENSFEYAHTTNRFSFAPEDGPALQEMSRLALKCWDIFELSGYARVDFRLVRDDAPYVLEINANPCISPDAGYIKAAKHAGLDYDAAVLRIIANPHHPL